MAAIGIVLIALPATPALFSAAAGRLHLSQSGDPPAATAPQAPSSELGTPTSTEDGTPATVVDDLTVDLGSGRDQIQTWKGEGRFTLTGVLARIAERFRGNQPPAKGEPGSP